MNRRTDNEDLLSEVLSEATPSDFRAAMLNETLHRVGRRRRWKQARGPLALLVVFGLIGFLVWPHLHRPSPVLPPVLAGKSYRLIQTSSLQSGLIVTTRSLNAEQMIVSTTAASIIQTRSNSEGFRVINDEELLALVASRPAALVRLGNSEQLVFADPEDAEGFPVN